MTEKTNKIHKFIEFIGILVLITVLFISIAFILINHCESSFKRSLSSSRKDTKIMGCKNKLEKEKAYEVKEVIKIERDKYTDKILNCVESNVMSRTGMKDLGHIKDIIEKMYNKHKSDEELKNKKLIIPKDSSYLELYSEYQRKYIDELYKDETLKNLAVYKWKDSNLNQVLVCGNLGMEFINIDEIYIYKIKYA